MSLGGNHVEVQKSLSKLEFYHGRMQFENNLYTWGLSKKIIKYMMGLYQYRNRMWFRWSGLLIRFFAFTAIWIGGVYGGYLRFPVVISLVLLFSMLILLTNQRTLRYKNSLKHDHFYKCLGEHRSHYLRYLVVHRIKNQLIEWLIPLSLFPMLYFTYIKQNPFIIPIYFILLLINYQVQVISSVFCNYYNRLYKHQVLLEALFMIAFNILLSTGITMIIGLYTLFHFVILPFQISDLMNANGYLLVTLLLSLSLLSYGFYTLINKWVDPFVKQHYVKITQVETYQIRRKSSKQMNERSFITSLFCFKMNEVEQIIIKKDLKMLIRGHKRLMITYLIFSFASIPLGIGYIAAATTSANDQQMISNGLMIIGWLVSLICYFFYQFKHITWLSSEGFNLKVYYMTKVNHLKLFKAKRRLNMIMALPAVIGFIITTVWLVFFVSINQILIYLFFVAYLFLILHLLIDTVLWLDVSKPPLHPEFKMYWIGDSSHIGLIGGFLVFLLPLVMGELMREIFRTPTLLAILLGILLILLLLWKLSINKRIRSLKNALMITFGGIIYDTL
jgi:hypothetical protein